MQSGTFFCNVAIRCVDLIDLFICEPVCMYTGSQRSGRIFSELPTVDHRRKGAEHKIVADGNFVFALFFCTCSVFYKGVSCI